MMEFRIYNVEDNKAIEIIQKLGSKASICNVDEDTCLVIINAGSADIISVHYIANKMVIHFVNDGIINEFKLEMNEFRYIEMI